MEKELLQPTCQGCHFSGHTTGQTGYAELKGIPLTQFCTVYCTVLHAYVFKNYSCKDFSEKSEVRR